MKELSLFTGMGGGIYGSMILGWQTLAYVEKDKYCQKVIAQRIADGWFDKGGIYGDIKDFNEKQASNYAGQVDVLTGGFPCQPFSVAGKRKGSSDERYLFNEIIKTIEIVRPARLFFENVPGLLNDPAIIEIYTKLEAVGYITKAPLLLGSDDCGGIHRRKRLWIYATDTKQIRRRQVLCSTPTGSKEEVQRQKAKKPDSCTKQRIRSFRELIEQPDIPKPIFFGVDDEFSNWRERLNAIGNGQDPIVMATAYKILSEQV